MGDIATELKSPTVAYYTLPPNLGKEFVGLTGPAISERFLALWRESVCFLNELAPHGYIVRDVESITEGKKVKVRLHLLVSANDYKRIKAEWDTTKPESNDHQPA